jgi:hypothetical protein
MLPVSLVEPVFQLRIAVADDALSLKALYIGLHVLALNVVQLCIFRRWDFMTMYSYRLVY